MIGSVTDWDQTELSRVQTEKSAKISRRSGKEERQKARECSSERHPWQYAVHDDTGNASWAESQWFSSLVPLFRNAGGGVPYEGLCKLRAVYDAKYLKRICCPSSDCFFVPSSVGNAALSSSRTAYRSEQHSGGMSFLAHSVAPPHRKKSRSACLFGCKRPRDGTLSLPTFCGYNPKRLKRIYWLSTIFFLAPSSVGNAALSSSRTAYRSEQRSGGTPFLAHSVAPPHRKKSRSARLFGCKRPRDGTLSLPTFCGYNPKRLKRIYCPSSDCFFVPSSVGNAALSVPR